METGILSQIIAYVQANWVTMVATLWLVEQLLRVISELTPYKWDDNISKVFTNILKKFFPKRQPTPPPAA